MGSQRIRIGLFGSALALGVALLLLVYHPRLSPVRTAIFALKSRALSSEASTKDMGVRVVSVGKEERSRLADALNSASGDVHSDLRLVNEIFIAYRGAIHSENPVGENSEITAALEGRNKLSYAFI